MKHVKCSGTPYEIGQQHGQTAKTEVYGSIAFYEAFFKERTNLSWSQVQDVSRAFLPFLDSTYPEYVEEMKGVADGAGVDLDSIVALNVRTEIAYGMLSDGCTAFTWKTSDQSFIGQNWDWRIEQTPNIISLAIQQPSKPTITMMTEGGIIGKIGLNSAGVGVTLNAISAPGVIYNKLPVHLALRTVLNSTSREEATSSLRKSGIAAAGHITIADAATGAVGLECTALDIVEMPMDNKGTCTHSNHLVNQHKVKENSILTDSPFRLDRVQELIKGIEEPTIQNLSEMLKDEKNYPAAICRAVGEKSTIATLFSIIMDLKAGVAKVKIGRPNEDGEVFELRP
ncbi:isopenicillin-N N-acyltransferase [Exophiala viscosa]|uniref:isopenicillin-N N-acyltransferase n=1 Tax=Exophiala viscosa TaxID=2486360 RepID=UPI0021A1FF57|nr:isopenicillin-N N-acyltransferase [Exophiala viscosa]